MTTGDEAKTREAHDELVHRLTGIFWRLGHADAFETGLLDILGRLYPSGTCHQGRGDAFACPQIPHLSPFPYLTLTHLKRAIKRIIYCLAQE